MAGQREPKNLQTLQQLASCRLQDNSNRGRYLYWVDAALGTLNWALLQRLILNDLELRQQFLDAADYPLLSVSSTKPFSVDHMLAAGL